MTLQPTTIDALQQAVRHNPAVRVRGGGTKSALPRGGTVISLSGLSGVTEYSPAECVFTALAGTPVRVIDEALDAHGQYLPFDPPFAADGATIGGTVASGVSGRGRYRYGGVRDFLIGVRVVDGEGRLIRSGGQVVKNAAGFLLHHGMVGSLGRFGVLTELTFKVFPQPEARRTITVECGSAADAFAAAREVERLRCDCEAIDFDERGTLSVQIAGNRRAIDARASRLADLLGSGRAHGAGTHGAGTDRASCVTASHGAGTDPASCVKVAGLMNSWQKLRDHVTTARFMCAGSVAWLSTDHLAGLARALQQTQLTGLVIRGPQAGERIGHLVHNEFEERVRRVLDPQNKFSAAPDSRR
ncbi:MAG TPA: FAD-binding protein [Vicinamibacterales bacterium]|nr:FAD-binding protein [Vicinamibacterales bacterium]